MIETEFHTEDVEPRERFDLWRARMSAMMVPMDMTSSHARAFWARMRLFRFGEVQVWPTSCVPMDFRRTHRLIRRSDPELYHLTLPLRGVFQVEQAGRSAACGVHEMYVLDTSRPFDCHMVDEPGPPSALQGVALELPRSLLPLPRKAVNRLLARPLSGGAGVGALFARFLTELTHGERTYRPSDGGRLERVVVDLLAALLAGVLDDEGAVRPETRRHVLELEIREYIQRNLHDPELTPARVADAHHISVSYLHRLFQDGGTGVAALIRSRRLEQACRELGDPALRQLAVHDIARRCGFGRHSVFTRAFRAAYGLSPRDYREQVRDRLSSQETA